MGVAVGEGGGGDQLVFSFVSGIHDDSMDRVSVARCCMFVFLGPVTCEPRSTPTQPVTLTLAKIIRKGIVLALSRPQLLLVGRWLSREKKTSRHCKH